MGILFAANSTEYIVINWASILSTFLVLVICLWLRLVSNVRRASLMLQAAVSFVDLIRHIRLLFNTIEDEKLCAGVAALSFFTDHLSMLLNVAIAANLHCVFLKGKMPGALWRRLLWLFPVSVALVLDVLPLALGVYGKAGSLCFIRSEHPYRMFFKIYLLYASLYVGLLYCLVISVLVYLKVLTQTISWLEPRGPTFGNYNMVVLNFAMRIALYPLSCFLSQAGFMAVAISFDVFHTRSLPLLSLAFFLQSTTGIINLICLCFDPSVAVMFRSSLCSGKPASKHPVYSLDSPASSKSELPSSHSKTIPDTRVEDACALKLLLDQF